MDEPELPTIHLNEKLLRNIRERERLVDKNGSCSKTSTSPRKNRKSPKHGFYKAGVTRLSLSEKSCKGENQVASPNRENTTKSPEEPKRDIETRKVRRKKNDEGRKSSPQFEKAAVHEEENEMEEVDDKTPAVATEAAMLEKHVVEQKGGRRQAERLRGSRSGRQQTDRKLYDPMIGDDRGTRTTKQRFGSSSSKTRQQTAAAAAADPPHRNLTAEHHIVPNPVPIEDRSVEDLLMEAECLKSVLGTHISKNSLFFTKYQLDTFLKCREELMEIYKEIILKDIIFTNHKTVDQRMWKNVFYHVVEMIRGRISREMDEEEKEKMQRNLMNILKHAASFYLELIQELSKRHRLNLSFSSNESSTTASASSCGENKKKPSKHAKMALMSCQRMLLSLGDVHRYMACVKDNTNFGEARRWYSRARHVEPRNGRPYNQLALLAVLTKRNFEAVYFYMRSLAPVGTPILSARESLIALFNDSRRKLEYVHSKQTMTTTSKGKEQNCTKNAMEKLTAVNTPVATATMGGDQANQHMWVKPSYTGEQLADTPPPPTHENTSTDDDLINSKQDDKPQQPAENYNSKKLKNEVYKKFILVFLNVHGVMFTRIGHDSFDELKTRSFYLLTQLLEDLRSKLSVEILVNIFVINSYSVLDQFNKAGVQGNGDEAPVQPGQAVEYIFGILIRICKQTGKLLQTIEDHIKEDSNNLESNDSIHESVDKVESLLAYIKLSFDWMYANKSIWCKDPDACEPCTGALMQSMAVLCDRVTYFVDHTAFGINITRQNGNNSSKKVVLPEDHEVLGFAPIQPLDGDSEQAYVDEYDMSNNSLLVYISVRLHYINDFLQYLCGRERPLLAFKDGSYISLVQATSVNNLNSDVSTATNSLNDDSFTSDDGLVVDSLIHLPGYDELRSLKDYRNILQMHKKNQQKRFDVISKSLADARRVQVHEILRVEPRYLVPDTNCFIDHLSLIQTVLKHGYYTICVPLVVLVELKGLAALCKTTTDEKHATYVNLRAKSAVKFLQYSFENKSWSDRKLPFDQHRHLKLKILTNQGSELKTLNFVCEEANANNDDLILQCCVKYEMKNRQYHRTVWSDDSETTTPITHRTVLLTDDRNLRVKSHAQNMPTRTLPNFYKWAAFANTTPANDNTSDT